MRDQEKQTRAFETERPRLRGVAARILADPSEAEDVVQQAWLRLHGAKTGVDDLPAWLTTVTVRLCLDRLRQRRVGELQPEIDLPSTANDPADEVEIATTVGQALHVVLDRLTPKERVAFVLHDSFGYEFGAIGDTLDTSPAAARKLASRARTKLREPKSPPADRLADWEIVDAFLAAAKGGDLSRLLQLLAPDAVVSGDAAAVEIGTPARVQGREEVAAFFNGAAAAALAVFVDDRPGAAWFNRGQAMVAFDFTLVDGLVQRIDFRAAPELLAGLTHRRGASTKL